MLIEQAKYEQISDGLDAIWAKAKDTIDFCKLRDAYLEKEGINPDDLFETACYNLAKQE